MISLSRLFPGYDTTRDWGKYYEMSQKQAITGIVLGELEKENPQTLKIPQGVLFHWIGNSELLRQKNIFVNKELEALHKLLNKHQIKYVVVKGQTVGTYYQRPELRTPGDIDFYCETEHASQAKEVITKEWDVMMEQGDSPYHYHFEHNGIIFELHFKLFLFYQEKRNEYWKNLVHNAMWYHVKLGNSQICTLEPTVHALYVFLHLYNHLVKVGVGLRQFCDLAVILKANVDLSALRKHLKTLGMIYAFRACEYILVECIGLDEKYLPYEIRPVDRRYGKKMLDVVMYRGNMGHYNKRNGWSGFGHQMESACIKFSHFVKFFWLSPRYHLGWMNEIIYIKLTELSL